MEKNQNIDNRNQDKTDNGPGQKQNEDLNKKVTDPNNPVAKDKQSGNQNQNADGRNQDKPKSGSSNKTNRADEDDDTLVDEEDADENDQSSKEGKNQSKNPSAKK